MCQTWQTRKREEEEQREESEGRWEEEVKTVSGRGKEERERNILTQFFTNMSNTIVHVSRRSHNCNYSRDDSIFLLN